MSDINEQFWNAVEIGQPLARQEYETKWEQQEAWLDGLDNNHTWFREISPLGDKMLEPIVLMRLAARLVHESLPEREGGVYSQYDVSFLKPVLWNERLTYVGTVADKYIKRGGKYCKFEVTVLDSAGDRVMVAAFHSLINIAEVRAARLQTKGADTK